MAIFGGISETQNVGRYLFGKREIVGTDAEMSSTFEIALPEKDRPILAAAVGAKADFLLTGDMRHFGVYFGKTIWVCGWRGPGNF